MAYPTKEFSKIIPFQFRLYIKVGGFGFCSACITILLTMMHGYIEVLSYVC